MAEENGDQPDIEESYPWSCPKCPASGTAASGLEASQAAVIHALSHKNED